MKAKLLNVLFVIVLILAGMLMFNNYKKQRQIKKDRIELNQLKAENTNMTKIIASNGQVITSQKQHIFSLEEAKEADLITIQELKDRNMKDASLILRLENKIARLELEATYNNKPDTIIQTVIEKDTTYLATYLKVPMGFTFEDEWTKVLGTVKTTGVTINELSIVSQGTIMMGWTKGYFKSSEPVITYDNKNPYITTTSMQNVVIKQKPPFYKTPMWHRLEGGLSMYLLIRGAQKVFNQNE